MEQGFVSLVGAGPGDPELISVKGLRRLRAADVVVYDALVGAELLDEARPEGLLLHVGKRGGQPAPSQESINALLVAHARAGRRVVRLKGGDPFVFGRGGEEAEALAAAGVAWEIVPGVSSAIAAPAAAGIPITHRELASSFAVVTGHARAGQADTRHDWGALARIDTLVVLMGVGQLATIAGRLLAAGRAAETPAAAVQWGTTSAQQTVVATLATIADAVARAGLGAPATLVIGDVVGLRERLGALDAPQALADAAPLPQLPALVFAD
jgi:uroporphyrin-III C-methyltransferase